MSDEVLWDKIHSFVKKARIPMADKLILIEVSRLAHEIVIGGSFDRLHYGHQAFINTAFELADFVHIGVMSDEGIRRWGHKKYEDKIEPFNKRVERLKFFLREYNLLQRSKIVKIDDPYSYALGEHSDTLDSILVSSEKQVIERTIELNKLRQERDLEPLQIFEIPLIRDERGIPISSTRIRAGDSFFSFLKGFPRFRLNERIASIIRKPIGELAKDVDDLPKGYDRVVVIGDYVLKYLATHGFKISVAIIDRRTRREDFLDYIACLSKAVGRTKIAPYIPELNPPGQISSSLWIKIALAYVQETPTLVRIYGEEDLAGFPAYLLAPNKTLIIYGQPPPINAMVYNIIDDELREKIFNWLVQMLRE